ncbi:hypothetical protein [Pseudoflavonifractor sp. An85]|uniref:hypothetical protein n=1 Tax=Pseudoflavonifractor sp. An85 TaxID=1965661 RepID=UPI000B369C05|nr:hypothetical protein [Pseudoflavonifractor sp. An85]OUN24217.1 hypothetical protein B5G37_07945 [Pseudoflavonifractor sp. An85]
MIKEYSWSVTVDGGPHEILCQVMNNKYVLWVDDKFEKTIYRKSFQLARGGLDETLELWGKTCHFVVWPSEKVEFFVDGRSLNVQEDDENALDTSYEATVYRFRQKMRRCSWGMAVLMTLICICFGVIAWRGVDILRWKEYIAVVLFVLGFSVIGIFRWR